MAKYRLLRERLLAHGVLAEHELVPAAPIGRALLALAHSPGYLAACFDGTLDEPAQRRIGFPWSPGLLARSLASAGATLEAAGWALEHGFAGALSGGTHHAAADAGAGYCVFNDLAVTTRAVLAAGRVRRVLIVDLDVHQGDGTAAILGDEPRAFTFSMHGEKNFPFRKQRSTLDVGLRDGCGDDEYLALLDQHLPRVFEAADPGLLLYQAGVDVLREDSLGRLQLSLAAVRQRDRRVLELARGRGVPIVTTLGGGYARPLEPTLAGHEGTWREARAIFG
jgi:acetoin utilization deacetylase AcuC-like enzyme